MRPRGDAQRRPAGRRPGAGPPPPGSCTAATRATAGRERAELVTRSNTSRPFRAAMVCPGAFPGLCPGLVSGRPFGAPGTAQLTGIAPRRGAAWRCGSAATGTLVRIAPQGRDPPAQGEALGHRPQDPPGPEGAAVRHRRIHRASNDAPSGRQTRLNSLALRLAAAGRERAEPRDAVEHLTPFQGCDGFPERQGPRALPWAGEWPPLRGARDGSTHGHCTPPGCRLAMRQRRNGHLRPHRPAGARPTSPGRSPGSPSARPPRP